MAAHSAVDQSLEVDEIVGRLADVLDAERIYLFGSRARGDSGPDSDYDFLAVAKSASEPFYRLSQRGYRALGGIDASVDVVVWDRKTFNGRLQLKASFPSTVVREGKLLYGG